MILSWNLYKVNKFYNVADFLCLLKDDCLYVAKWELYCAFHAGTGVTASRKKNLPIVYSTVHLPPPPQKCICEFKIPYWANEKQKWMCIGDNGKHTLERSYLQENIFVCICSENIVCMSRMTFSYEECIFIIKVFLVWKKPVNMFVNCLTWNMGMIEPSQSPRPISALNANILALH